MPWINGRWRPEGWQTGGFPGLLDLGGRDRPGVYNQPPQINPPGYSKGPQMQPTPYKPVQWAGPDAIYPNWGDPAGPYANDVAMIPMGDPYKPHTPWQSGLAPRQPWTPPPQMPIQGPPIPPRMAAPGQQPIYYRGPQMRPTLPTIDPIRPPIINPGGGWDTDPGIPPTFDPDPGIPGQEDPDPEIIRPPIPPRDPTILPPPPKRDRGAEERARRLAQQKARAAAKRARDLAKQKAAAQRERDLAGQKRAAANKRARDKAEATRQRGRGDKAGDLTPPPATRPGRTQEGKGPKGPRTITGVARSQNTQRGDR